MVGMTNRRDERWNPDRKCCGRLAWTGRCHKAMMSSTWQKMDQSN